MYHPHRPGRWFQLLGKPPVFLASRGVFEAANLVLGRWGNKLALSAIRSQRRMRQPSGCCLIPVASVLDRIFLFGVVLLTVATPMALGSVKPSIYSIAEAAIFGLVIIALLKAWIAHIDVNTLSDPGTRWIAAGLALFAGLALAQTLSFPPSLDRPRFRPQQNHV